MSKLYTVVQSLATAHVAIVLASLLLFACAGGGGDSAAAVAGAHDLGELSDEEGSEPSAEERVLFDNGLTSRLHV